MKLPKFLKKIYDAVEGPPRVDGQSTGVDQLYSAKNEMRNVESLPQTTGGGVQKDTNGK